MRQIAAELRVRAVDRRQELVSVVISVALRYAARDVRGGETA